MDVQRKLAELLDIFKLEPNRCQRFKSAIKIWLFHSSFTFFVLLYIAMGAAIMSFTERSQEMGRREQKLERVLQMREKILDRASQLCQQEKLATIAAVEAELKPLLKELSSTHEYDDRFSIERQKWTDDVDEVKPMWTFYATMLYAVTVLTATGYDRLTPQTDAGRLFAIGYGLLGIPLMFIYAANIGRFLSNIVTLSCIKVSRFYTRYIGPKLSTRRLSTMGAPPAASGTWNRLNSIRKSIYGLWFDPSDPSPDPELDIHMHLDGDMMDYEQSHVPPIVVIGLIAGYCTVGALLFMSFEEGASWSFSYALWFAFITIATITLGDVRVDCGPYLALLVVYCIVGLAMITMCVDLVSIRFKILFTKVHYYGRKLALMKARARAKAEAEAEDGSMGRALGDVAQVAAIIKQFREAMTAGAADQDDTSSKIIVERQTIFDEQGRPTFAPINLESIPWVDSSEMDDTKTATSLDTISYI